MHFNCRLVLTTLIAVLTTAAVYRDAAQGQTLTESNYEELVPKGKEVDAIYGDLAIHNRAAKAIVADTLPSRHANMTVRDVAGCLIDFANTAFESDQLSAFYPGRRQFLFSESSFDAEAVTVTSPGGGSKPQCVVRYELDARQPVLNVATTWTNTTENPWTVRLEDDLRVDAAREDITKSRDGDHDLLYVDDVYWQQAYGIRAEGFHINSVSNDRESVLVYQPLDGELPVLQPGEQFTFERQIIVARDRVELRAVASQLADPDAKLQTCELGVVCANNHPVANAQVKIDRDGSRWGIVRTNHLGTCQLRLPPGEYPVTPTIDGIDQLGKEHWLRIAGDDGSTKSLTLDYPAYRPGSLLVTIHDHDRNEGIPFKMELRGVDGTPTPRWGPDSADRLVRNVAYVEKGHLDIRLQEGEYDVIVSHGPEYEAVFKRITIESGQRTAISTKLKRSVDTTGWISSDFHSHSSPSGDNTGSQLGRVLNLAAEHIEFAPCTEHNRISTYENHIALLGLEKELATVSGMELTGQPLPLNHQNVFPLIHTPRTQDGGAPQTDANPETQIERVTLADNRSEKLVQQNHPDIGWLFYDRNGDGSPDEGYWRSFRLMDAMEIHPIDRILTLAPYETKDGVPSANQRMFNWLQLLNQGHRIYGVVNTDAHYNYHGSGWLRNWIQSKTDNPGEIDPLDIVHAAEQGRLVMSNGPFLEATFRAAAGGAAVVCGQDLNAPDGRVVVDIRVQCPGWFNIDRVFLLVNGRMVESLSFTRRDHPEMFTDEVIKFEESVEVDLQQDSHIIVVAGHRIERLGPVMGPSGGAQRPAALTNPVFVDVDGNGFTPNKDTLGHPLPVKFNR